MFEEWFSLENKVALVTGAGRGLGQSMAVGLAEAGADLICFGRDEEKPQGNLPPDSKDG